jgi:CBS domain containing-hemolysin-like protein
MSPWLLLAAALVLIAANGVYVAAEFGLVAVEPSAVDRAKAGGDRRAARVSVALRSLSTQLSGAQVGITVTSLLVGYLAEPSLAALLHGPLRAIGVDSSVVPGISVAVALILATIVQMVFGELVPKNLAIARPLPTARAVVDVQRATTWVFAPLIRLLNTSANALLRLGGIEPAEELRSARSPQELRSLLRRSAEAGTLPSDTARLLARSLTFPDKTAEDVMTPRVQVRFVHAGESAADVVAAAVETGHSRFPVIGEDVDDVVGLVHVKHAVAVPYGEREAVPVARIMVPPVLAPATLGLDELLDQLRASGLQIAVVVDEYGGTAGVVTLEDIVEELVGDIGDEHDPLSLRAYRHADGTWSLSGLLRPDEVAELTGVQLPDDPDYDTVAGLVLHRLGRIPARGETVEVIATVGGNVALATLDGRPAIGPDPEGLARPLPVCLRVERVTAHRIGTLTLAASARALEVAPEEPASPTRDRPLGHDQDGDGAGAG